MPTDPFNDGRAAALTHGRRELNPYKSNPTVESIYTEYASAWDSGFILATTHMSAMPNSNLDEIREYVRRTIPGESIAVIDNVTYELWRESLKAAGRSV